MRLFHLEQCDYTLRMNSHYATEQNRGPVQVSKGFKTEPRASETYEY